MSKASAAATLWAPRLAAFAMSLFLALFALDAFNGKPLANAIPAFLVHLAPSLLVVGVLALAWRRPLIGAAVFAGLAVLYSAMVRWRLDWTLAISGPLMIVAALFFLSWRVSSPVLEK